MARTILLLLLLAAANGCSATRDSLDDLSIYVHNRTCACRAWHESGWARLNPPHVKHFEDGFIAGYVDVASGKSGCPPPLPPRKYWSPSSLHSTGRRTSLAWYNGYSQGAASAQEDGVCGWSRLDGVEPAAYQEWNDPGAVEEVLGEVPTGTVQRLPFVEGAVQPVPVSSEAWHAEPAAGPARG